MTETKPKIVKPNYLDLITKRVAADSRPTFKVRTCLVPELESELAELRALPANRPERRSIADAAPPNPSADRIVELELAIDEATLVITLQALSVGDLLASNAGEAKDRPAGEQWKSDLAQAFVVAHNADGALVEDVGRDEWRALLAVLPAAQVQRWHAKLSAVGMGVDFPTSAKL